MILDSFTESQASTKPNRVASCLCDADAQQWWFYVVLSKVKYLLKNKWVKVGFARVALIKTDWVYCLQIPWFIIMELPVICLVIYIHQMLYCRVSAADFTFWRCKGDCCYKFEWSFFGALANVYAIVETVLKMDHLTRNSSRQWLWISEQVCGAMYSVELTLMIRLSQAIVRLE